MSNVTVPFQLGPGGKAVNVRVELDQPPDVPPPPPPPMPPDLPFPPAPNVQAFVGALLRRAYVGEVDPGEPDPDTVPPPSKPGYAPDIWGRGGDPALRTDDAKGSGMGELANVVAMVAVVGVATWIFGSTLRAPKRRR
jgi:hypothetical protein